VGTALEFLIESLQHLGAFEVRHVELETHGLDRYGRTLAVIFVDGTDVNLDQVTNGFAWVHSKYILTAPTDIQASYRQAEAPKDHRGLWNDPNPIPPSDWRRSKKNAPGWHWSSF
jgi:endonuclease YncB( thermonuclease family)